MASLYNKAEAGMNLHFLEKKVQEIHSIHINFFSTLFQFLALIISVIKMATKTF